MMSADNRENSFFSLNDDDAFDDLIQRTLSYYSFISRTRTELEASRGIIAMSSFKLVNCNVQLYPIRARTNHAAREINNKGQTCQQRASNSTWHFDSSSLFADATTGGKKRGSGTPKNSFEALFFPCVLIIAITLAWHPELKHEKRECSTKIISFIIQ